MATKKEVGKKGQDEAERFLKHAGYYLVERNWRTRLGEVDLVFQDKERNLVLIEVKTLFAPKFSFQPEYHLTWFKQKKLRQLAFAYLHYRNLMEVGYRIDLVAVELNEDFTLRAIRHYPNVVEGI